MLTFCSDQKSASKATLLIISAHCTLICVEMQSQSLQTKLLVYEKLENTAQALGVSTPGDQTRVSLK